MATTPTPKLTPRLRSESTLTDPPTVRRETTIRRSPRRSPKDVRKRVSPPSNIVASIKAPIKKGKDLDDQMADYSRPHIHAMARYFRAQVDMKWVRACATQLNGQDDVREYRMLSVVTDRHIHYVNPSVIAFIRCLAKTKLHRVTTWQFSAGSAHAIHMGRLKSALKKQSPTHWIRLMTFACSIGLPIHKLIDTVDVFKRWHSGRFKTIDSDGTLIKLALRPRFEIDSLGSDVECRQLLQAYKEDHNVFKACSLAENVYERKYLYPTVAEMRNMFDRLMANLSRWLSPPKPKPKPNIALGMI